jgi:hypothetical protein
MGAKALQPAARDLYESDFFDWTVKNAALLRAGRFAEADIERIAEELEDMGRRERRELASRLQVLITHLLKWHFQSEFRSRSWQSTIKLQRREIVKLLEEMPSLRNALQEGLERAYRWAAEDTVEEMGLLRNPFPAACPFTLDRILDPAFLPD